MTGRLPFRQQPHAAPGAQTGSPPHRLVSILFPQKKNVSTFRLFPQGATFPQLCSSCQIVSEQIAPIYKAASSNAFQFHRTSALENGSADSSYSLFLSDASVPPAPLPHPRFPHAHHQDPEAPWGWALGLRGPRGGGPEPSGGKGPALGAPAATPEIPPCSSRAPEASELHTGGVSQSF